MIGLCYLAITTPLVLTVNYLVDDLPYLEDQDCDQCERVYVPICGTDNRTYVNICKMQCVNMLAPKELRPGIYMYGPCISSGRRTDAIGYNETFLMNQIDKHKMAHDNGTTHPTVGNSSSGIIGLLKRSLHDDFHEYLI